MELTQLKYFCAAAENQHITKTAELLHIAQPALSQSIHRLEKELGVPLFASKGRNIVLTECGEYLKNRLTPIIASIDRIPDELRSMANPEVRTINMNVLAASTLVTAAMIDYKKEHRNVNFRLSQTGGSEVVDITVSTRFSDRHPAESAEFSRVFTEDIYIAVPAGSRWDGASAVDLSDFAGEDIISLAGSKQFRVICDRLCLQSGFSPNIVFESDSPAAVRNFVAAGLGAAFWPQYTWGNPDTSGIVLLPIRTPQCRRDIFISLTDAKKDVPEIRGFYDFLVEHFESLDDNA